MCSTALAARAILNPSEGAKRRSETTRLRPSAGDLDTRTKGDDEMYYCASCRRRRIAGVSVCAKAQVDVVVVEVVTEIPRQSGTRCFHRQSRACVRLSRARAKRVVNLVQSIAAACVNISAVVARRRLRWARAGRELARSRSLRFRVRTGLELERLLV